MNTKTISDQQQKHDQVPSGAAAQDLAPNSTETHEEHDASATEENDEPKSIIVKIFAPNGASLGLNLTGSELVQEIKQVVAQSAETIEYTCFDLTFEGQPLDNHITISEIVQLLGQMPKSNSLSQNGQQEASETTLIVEIKEKSYTEREVRTHINRLRDLLSGVHQTSDPRTGVDVGATIFPMLNDRANPKTSSKSKASQKKARTAVNTNSAVTGNKSSSKDKKASQKAPAFKVSAFNAPTPLTAISTQPWRSRIKPEPCLKQITLSGWNPVQPHRYLKGDLLYIELITLENVTYHITAGLTGFYVNQSTAAKFDPTPADPLRDSHSLISLVRKLSPRFTKNFECLQVSFASLYPLETIPINSVSQAAAPWVVPNADDLTSTPNQKSRDNAYDLARTQQTYLRYGPRATDAIRDWNEELQTIREIDASSLNDYEGALKDNQLLVWQNEFTEAAIAGAMAVVDGEVLPLNPTELPSQFIYLRENIFFSKANDSRDVFSSLGGDSAALVAASKDVQGVQVLNGLDTKNVFQLGTVMIDYRGNRIIAQTVVPGILRTENENPVIYGSVDNGNTIKSNPDFHKLIEPIAAQLKLKEHELKDSNGDVHKLYTSIDVKGIKGTDGRKYLVDLFRLFPVDSEFLETYLDESKELGPYPHKMTLIRSELLSLYWEHCIRNHVRNIIAKKQESKRESTAVSGDEVKVEGQSKQNGSADASRDSIDEDLISATNEELDSDVLLNQDSFVPISLSEKNREFNEAVLAGDKEAVANVSKFLHSTVIPDFVNELVIASLAPITGRSLTRHMHNRGINVRYLGKIANLLPKDTKATFAVYSLIVREMISRSVKHLLRYLFMTIDSRVLQPLVFAYVINSLLGINCDEITDFADISKMVKDCLAEHGDSDILSSIKNKVAVLYRFKLDDSWAKDFVLGYKRIILREICLKAGVQITLRNYDSFLSNKHVDIATNSNSSNSSTTPYLSASDVLNFVPLIRVAGTPVPMPSATLEYGRTMIAEGKKELGLGLIHNLCLLHEQKCGNVHPATASCYSDLATCYHEIQEHATAIDLMHQAIISNERSSGLDDTETIYNYLNLAMFEHANGNTESAIQFINHALDLWKLVGTLDHPILSVIYSNIAAMHQKYAFDTTNQSDPDLSRKLSGAVLFFELSANLREKLYGLENILTATSVLNLGKATASTGDLKTAINKIMEAYTAMKKLLGEEDPRTVDAKQWLDKVTSLAVENAKNAQIATATQILTTAHEQFVASAPKGSHEKKISLEQYNKMLTDGVLSLQLDEKRGINTVRRKSDLKNMTIDDLYNFVTGEKKSQKQGSSSKRSNSSKLNSKKKN